MTVDTSQNSSFSKDQPGLQVCWDSTSLGSLKTCPRYYEYNIIHGYQPRRLSVHLIFGTHYHKALERYDHARAEGQSHDDAQEAALLQALSDTWDSASQKPWDSDDANKNRWTLVRSVVWYLEQFRDDPAKTVILANGKPAVELSFRFESGYSSPLGEPYLLCGHLDRLAELGEDTWVLDRKTSKSLIDQSFFEKFTPDLQFTIYTFASKVVYKTPVKGIICDGAQIAVTFSRFLRGSVLRTNSQLEEFHKDFGYWLTQAEGFAKAQYWPMNEKSCSNYGGCPYREICALTPEMRQKWLDAKYIKRTWDPMQVRGDI